MIMDPAVRTALGALLAAPEVIQYEEYLRNQNTFQILGIQKREVSHSAFLAWLLDPFANHGMGPAPLKRFLMRVAVKASKNACTNGSGLIPLDPVDVDSLDLDSLLIETEVAFKLEGVKAQDHAESANSEAGGSDEECESRNSRRFDLLITRDPGKGDQAREVVLAVEYKVNARESNDQTKAYARWARKHPVNVNGERRLPLLVYLCPDTKACISSEHFIHLDYNEYCAWLVSLKKCDRSKRAKFLIDEFLACIRQRPWVETDEGDALLAKVRGKFDKDISLLQKARLKPTIEIVQRHRHVLEALAIVAPRVASYGESSFVKSATEILGQVLAEDLWIPRSKRGTNGSLNFDFKPFRESLGNHYCRATDRQLPPATLQLWMERPKNGNATLEMVIPNRDEKPIRMAVDKRLQLVRDLRDHLSTEIDHQDIGKGDTAIVFKIKLQAYEGSSMNGEGTETTAAYDQLLEVARQLKALEQPLLQWTRDKLPGLLH